MGQAESTPGQNGAATHPEGLTGANDGVPGIDNNHPNGGKAGNSTSKQLSRGGSGLQFSQKSLRNLVPSRGGAAPSGNSQSHGTAQPPQHHGEQANPVENGHHPALHQEYEKRSSGRRQQQQPMQFSSKQQQQQYEYQQQQQQQQQYYYQQQQQQQRQSKKQPFYNQQQGGQQHPQHLQQYSATGGVIINPRPPLMPPGQQHKVDVMYAFEGNHNHSASGSRSGGGFPNRGGIPAMGGATAPAPPPNPVSLQHQMQNLSMYPKQGAQGPVVPSAPATAPVGQKMKSGGMGNDEDKWKTAWDDDDESSGGEDGDDRSGPLPGSSARNALPPPPSSSVAAAVHQPFRPSMDGGHSSSSPIKRPVGSGIVGDHGVSFSAAPSANIALQQQLPPSRLPPPFPASSAVTGGAGNLAPRSHGVEDENVIAREAILQEAGDIGVQWDTSVEDDKPNVRMFFPLLRVLGKGSFGKVVLVQKRTGRDKGGLFAMKILRKAHLLKRRQIDRTKTERKVLSIVDHPFIMKLHFAFQTEDKLYLVLDYCPGGELFFHLSRYRKFPERVARFYAAELLLALGHLHKKGIIYRDLKPENVLLDAEGHVKLGDFGLAKDRIKHPCTGATSMCGTPEYMAPEVLSQIGHGFCVDYWGLGMLVYEMMTGLPPWYTTDRTKLFKRLKGAPLEFPQYFTPHARSFVGDLLERNPRRRLGVLGARSVMEHDYFRSMDFRALIERRIDPVIRPCEGWRAPESENNPNGGANNFTNTNATNAAASMQQKQDGNQISSHELEAATENFDKTFTRMPVDTEDTGENEQQSGDEGGGDVLHENTFIGFTFDEVVHNKKKSGFPPASSSPQAYGSRRN